MKTKRFLSLLLAAITLIGLFPVTRAQAAAKPFQGGTYYIVSALDYNKVLDIYCMGSHNGANAQIYQLNNCGAQKFRVTWRDGWCTIVNEHSGKALDVQGGATHAGANVWQYEQNNSDAQKWELIPTHDGYWYIKAKCGKYLDVSGGSAANDTNVQIWDFNGSKAQKWRFVPVSPQANEGFQYYILPTSNTAQALEIKWASTANYAKARLFSKNLTNAQLFSIDFLDNGYCRIINDRSGKALTVESHSVGAKVSQYTVQNGNDRQEWYLMPTLDGYYQIVSKNGYYLDVRRSEACVSYAVDGASYQKFKLESTSSFTVRTLDCSSLYNWLQSSRSIFTLSRNCIVQDVEVVEYGTLTYKVPTTPSSTAIPGSVVDARERPSSNGNPLLDELAPDFSWAKDAAFDPRSNVPGKIVSVQVPTKILYKIHSHTYNSGFGNSWTYAGGSTFKFMQRCDCGLYQNELYFEVPLPDFSKYHDNQNTQDVINTQPQINVKGSSGTSSLTSALGGSTSVILAPTTSGTAKTGSAASALTSKLKLN